MPSVATDESLIGSVFADKYRIVRLIGKGGMGVVFEAEHKVLGKRVAIKLMLDKYFEDSEAKRRFEREAQAASRVGNAHIIDVSDIGTLPDGRPFVVMELLNGLPMSDVLERSGPMPPWRAIAIMRQVLRAVGAAHANGVIHRDLKPDNIFLNQQGDQQDFVKLLDFGISKVLDPNEQVAFTKLTSTGVVMGTPLYMAPEQAMGQPAGPGADIYACGVMLYEMLAGRTPFVGQTYAVLVAQLLTAPPEPLQNLRPGLPAALVNAVHKALEKDPARRFLTAEMFAASLPGDRTVSQIELAGTLDSAALAAVPRGAATTQRGPKSKAPILAVGAALLLGVATAGVLIVTQTGKEAPKNEQAKVEPKPEPPKTEPAPKTEPTPKTGLLKITSIPDKANVFIDDKKEGVTPLEIMLDPGKHVVRLELDGYDSFETETEVDAGSNRFAGTLVKARKSGGATAGGRPRPSGTLVKLPPTPAGITVPLGKTMPQVGPTKGVNDLPPSGPPQRDPNPPRKLPEKPPVEGGKTNPYTKGNPYTNGRD